jgi:hypothetical protein
MLVLATGLAALAQEIVVRGTDLPHEVKVEAPEAGYLWLEFPAPVAGLTPFLEVVEPKGVVCSSVALEARVPKGPLTLRLSDRWGRKPDVEIRAKVRFAAEKDAFETNDTADAARPAKFGQAMEVSIMPREDQDWFVLEAPGPGYLRVVWGATPNGLTPWCDFYREVVHQGTDLVRTEGGKVHVRLTDRWGGWSSPETFRVSFEFVEENDLLEPNDAPKLATAIENNLPYDVILAPAGDQDWFLVTAPGQGYLVPEVLEGPDFQTAWVFRPVAEGSEEMTSPVFATAGGPVLLRFSTRWGGADFNPYRIRVRFVPESDQLESATAATATIGTWYTVSFATAGDVDRCILNVERRSYCNISWTGFPKGWEMAWTLKPENGEAAAWQGWGGLQAGRYEVSWREKNGKSSFATFRLRFNLEEDPDRAEPQDDRASATPLRFNESRETHLLTDSDVDWFRVEVPEAGILYVLESQAWSLGAKAEHFSITLEDASGKQVPCHEVGKRKFGRIFSVSPGTWYIRAGTAAEYSHLVLTVDLATSAKIDVKDIHPSGVVFGFIGLDVDPATNAALEILARASGGVFRNATSSEGIEKEIRTMVVATAVAKIQPPPAPPAQGTSGGVPVLAIVAGGFILFAVAAGLFVWRFTR